MRFYATRTEAIQTTYSALLGLDQRRKGSINPSRAIRVATFYGHLQCRADASGCAQLALRELASAWHLQPRLLREDLADLQALGWLSFRADVYGTRVQLHEVSEAPGDERKPEQGSRDLPEQPTAEVSAEPVGDFPEPEVLSTELNSPEPSAEPERTPAMHQLISAFAAVYNQHKPESWPAYKPTGAVLANRLRQAIRQAGGTEAFEAVLIQALRGMPEFWRVTYPEGRSGAECAGALLKVDRASEGRGVEHWHLFSWAALAQRHCSGNGGNTAAVGQDRPAAMRHPEHRRACKLLAWDGHAWKGKGMEAARLPANELQRLAEILEAAGFGKPGTAAEQFAQEEEARR